MCITNSNKKAEEEEEEEEKQTRNLSIDSRLQSLVLVSESSRALSKQQHLQQLTAREQANVSFLPLPQQRRKHNRATTASDAYSRFLRRHCSTASLL